MFNFEKSSSKGQIKDNTEVNSFKQNDSFINENIYLTNYQKQLQMQLKNSDQLSIVMQHQNMSNSLLKVSHPNLIQNQNLSRSGSNQLPSQQGQNLLLNKYYLNQDEVIILIEGFKFLPSSFYVHSGTKLTWSVKQNKSSYNSIYDSSGPRFFIISIPQLEEESQPIHENESFSYFVEQLGTFDIVCPNYTRMKGQVVVVDKQTTQSDLLREQNPKGCFMEHVDEFKYSQNQIKQPQQTQINSSINHTTDHKIQKSINLYNENSFSSIITETNKKNISDIQKNEKNTLDDSSNIFQRMSSSFINEQKNNSSQNDNHNNDNLSQILNQNDQQQDFLKQSSKQEKILTKIIDENNQEPEESEKIAKQFMKELQDDQDNQSNKKKNIHYLQLYKDDFQEDIDEDDEEDDEFNITKQTKKITTDKIQSNINKQTKQKIDPQIEKSSIKENKKIAMSQNSEQTNTQKQQKDISQVSFVQNQKNLVNEEDNKLNKGNEKIVHQNLQSKQVESQNSTIDNKNDFQSNININCDKQQNNKQTNQEIQELEKKNEVNQTNNAPLKGSNPQFNKQNPNQFGIIGKNNQDDEFNNDIEEDDYQYDCSTIISEEDTSVYTSKENSLVYRRNNSSSNLCSSGGVVGHNFNPNKSFTASQTLNKHLNKRIRRNYIKKPKIGILSESYLKSPAQSILTTAESSKYSDTTKQLSQKGDFELEGSDMHERGGLLFQNKYSQKRRASTDQTIQETRYHNSINNEDSDTRSIRSLKNEPNTINNSNLNQNNNNNNINNNVCCSGFGCQNASCGIENYLNQNQNHFNYSSESDNESEWADLFQNCNNNNNQQSKNKISQNYCQNTNDQNKFDIIKQQSMLQFLNFTENINKQNNPKKHLKKQINSQFQNQSTGSLEGLSENREESKSFSSQNTNSLSPQKHICNKVQKGKKLIENYKQNTHNIQNQMNDISTAIQYTNEQNQQLHEQISFMQSFLEQRFEIESWIIQGSEGFGEAEEV